MKILMIGGMLFSLMGLTSCKKDWVCKCSGYVASQPYNFQQPIQNATHSDAVDNCKATEANINTIGQPNNIGTTNVSCSIN